MKNIILTLILTLTTFFSFSQKILYVVDSIPVIEEPKEGFGTLTQDEIDNVVTVKDKKTIVEAGYKNIDQIIYVYTKAYAQRPDSIKAIPTTKLMTRKNGAWCLKESTTPYSGTFIDYFLNGKKQGEGILHNGKLKGKRFLYYINGNVSDEIEYENGISHGIEKRFHEDGSLKQEGEFKHGKEVGVWTLYHPNGQVQQLATFNEYGKMDGEVVSYYSTGEIKGKNTYVNGVYKKDKINNKLFNLYNEGQAYYKERNFKSAIKKYTKCIKLDENWADAYFARGSAKLNNFQFDEAMTDFNKTLEIEPYFTNAYANRAFTIIQKYEFGNSRMLSKSKDVMIMASKETKIPAAELTKVCTDLKKGISLGDTSPMVLNALEKHCKE